MHSLPAKVALSVRFTGSTRFSVPGSAHFSVHFHSFCRLKPALPVPALSPAGSAHFSVHHLLPTKVGAPGRRCQSARPGWSPSSAPIGATGRSPLHIYASASFYLLPTKASTPSALGTHTSACIIFCRRKSALPVTYRRKSALLIDFCFLRDAGCHFALRDDRDSTDCLNNGSRRLVSVRNQMVVKVRFWRI